MNYTLRNTCIFCNCSLNIPYLSEDYKVPVAHYPVDLNTDFKTMMHIPFNIFKCPTCKTSQIKYLGNVDEIYKVNHADSTGTTMLNLHDLNSNFILKYKNNIRNIIEIGSSKGVLADLILKENDMKYFIIEPSFNGYDKNKIILKDFYENIDDTHIDANTIVISHVFEHFYNPKQILEKITKNSNIENFFLVFPNFEQYIDNNILHVLNTEHTFYIDNSFLISLLDACGFELVEQKFYLDHSVLFYFKRVKSVDLPIKVNFANQKYDLIPFFKKIKETVTYFNDIIEQNKDKKIYIWPSSAHTMRLIEFGLNQTNITGMLDNSSLKIGKKMYGCNLPIYSYKTIINTEQPILLLNGGPFNKEVEAELQARKIVYYKHS